jgi:hypothetical protein
MRRVRCEVRSCVLELEDGELEKDTIGPSRSLLSRSS